MRPSMHRHANTTNASQLLLRHVDRAVHRLRSGAQSETGFAPRGA